MTRPRKSDRHLPQCVYFKHGRFWYVKAGKWNDLGTDMAAALADYAKRISTPKGGMPDLIDRALAAHAPKIARNTLAQYKLAAEYLKEALREFSPEQVKPKHVAAIKASGLGTPNMTNRRVSFLRTVFDYAVEWQEVESNPCVGIRRHKEARRKRYITDDEFRAIYAKAGPRLQVIMDLQYLTGQRIDDVLKLRRKQITEAGIMLKPTKTQNSSGAEMLLKWSPQLMAAVERAKALYGNVAALTLLHGRTGRAPHYGTVALQWRKAAAAAGVLDADPNDLRAKAATDAKKQGQDPRALLGHTSDAMTERYLRQHETPEVNGPSFRQALDVGQKR